MNNGVDPFLHASRLRDGVPYGARPAPRKIIIQRGKRIGRRAWQGRTRELGIVLLTLIVAVTL